MHEWLKQFRLWLHDILDEFGFFLRSSVFAYVQQEMKPAWGSAFLVVPKEQVCWTGA